MFYMSNWAYSKNLKFLNFHSIFIYFTTPMESILIDKCPTFGYGVAVPVGDKIFIHGGIDAPTCHTSSPSNSCYLFDLTNQIWQDINKSKSPALSFHCAYVTEDRYVHLVGGWNGKSRSSCVYIFDVQNLDWLSTCKTIGFPNGAGLSGHTAVPTKNGGCLITGRLGGLQTQRRFGTVLTLHPIVFPTVFKYEILSDKSIQSRSGHTCTAITVNGAKSNSCLLLGGREQDVVEMVQYDRVLIDTPVTLHGGYHRTILDKVPSRRYHIAVPTIGQHGPAVLMHGGESFSSTAKGPSTQGPCVTVVCVNASKRTDQCGLIYSVAEYEGVMIRLTGHKAVRVQDRVFIIGGFGEKWKPNKNLYELKL